MSLNVALVDQARRVFTAQDPADDWEEEPGYGDKTGPWFRARLTVHQPREQNDSGRGYRFLQGDAELMFGVRDAEGGFMADETGRFVAFEADDAIEVASRDLGTQRWNLATGVEPIRKKRRVIGYRVGLQRSEEPSVERQ